MTPAEAIAVVREALNVGPLPRGNVEREKLDAGYDALALIEQRMEELEREARRADALTFAIEKGMVRNPEAEARIAQLEEALEMICGIENISGAEAKTIARAALVALNEALK